MGTRCDFYVGRGKDAEWLGSNAWDGYPDGIANDVLEASGEANYREKVTAFLAGNDGSTLPKDGWPWPWDDSQTTDYAYAFDAGKVWASCFGSEWFDPLKEQPDDLKDKAAVFPNMKAI